MSLIMFQSEFLPIAKVSKDISLRRKRVPLANNVEFPFRANGISALGKNILIIVANGLGSDSYAVKELIT